MSMLETYGLKLVEVNYGVAEVQKGEISYWVKEEGLKASVPPKAADLDRVFWDWLLEYCV